MSQISWIVERGQAGGLWEAVVSKDYLLHQAWGRRQEWDIRHKPGVLLGLSRYPRYILLANKPFKLESQVSSIGIRVYRATPRPTRLPVMVGMPDT